MQFRHAAPLTGLADPLDVLFGLHIAAEEFTAILFRICLYHRRYDLSQLLPSIHFLHGLRESVEKAATVRVDFQKRTNWLCVHILID